MVLPFTVTLVSILPSGFDGTNGTTGVLLGAVSLVDGSATDVVTSVVASVLVSIWIVVVGVGSSEVVSSVDGSCGEVTLVVVLVVVAVDGDGTDGSVLVSIWIVVVGIVSSEVVSFGVVSSAVVGSVLVSIWIVVVGAGSLEVVGSVDGII